MRGAAPFLDFFLRHGSLLALAGAVAVLALVVGYVIWESRIPPGAGTTMTGFLLLDRWDPSGQPPLLGIGHAWVATLMVVSAVAAVTAGKRRSSPILHETS